MNRVFSSYRLIVAFVVSLLFVGSAVELSASPLNDITPAFEHSIPLTENSTIPESYIENYTPTLALSETTYSSQAVSPIARNLQRNSRQTTRINTYSAAVRSIDSTQAKSRAGLFNHKILFYAYPRHYYLNGLVRLII